MQTIELFCECLTLKTWIFCCFVVLRWYMWKNTGSPIFHWKLKRVCQGNHHGDSCDVEHYLLRDVGKNLPPPGLVGGKNLPP